MACLPRVIHANNVLAHVPDIHDLVEGIGILLDDDGAAIVETPYLVDLLDRGLFETIYHEHVFYYSLGALQELFASTACRSRTASTSMFTADRCVSRFAKARVVEPTARAVAAFEAESSRALRSESAYSSFVAEVSQERSEIIEQFRRIKASGKSLAGYGAAAKATVLLNFASIDSETIDYVVDRNPAKQGRIIPGTGIAVGPVERLHTETPDVVAVLVWNLADEVRSQLQWYTDAGGELIVPLEERRGLDRGTAGRTAPSHS